MEISEFLQRPWGLKLRIAYKNINFMNLEKVF